MSGVDEPRAATPDSAPVVIGVDGGGTGSRAVVLDAGGRELGREVGSAAIVIPGSETASMEAIRDLVRRVLRAAGVPEGRPARALVAGLAGVGREADRLRIETMLSTSMASLGLARSVLVRNDAEVALHDVFGTGPGILLVGGTGSIALARLPSGRSLRTGGWGALAGDEGSGWSLGLGAARAVLRSLDGRGPPTTLTDHVTRAFGTREPAELVDRLRTAAKGQVAALAPQVEAAARAGDEVAAGLADRAAAALADHVAPLIRAWHADLGGETASQLEVALLGGLVARGGPLRSRLLPRLEAMGAVPTPQCPDPARGAARLALPI
ncbi:MAG: hypothetical protein EA350_01780 [Gemmatimonadales bacterium]|nr:MAG: hypothetical protein EA350_01780 [Gemmatimonadales bacterium]